MLRPEDASEQETSDLTSLQDSLRKQRLQESIMIGAGRGSEYAHGLGSVVMASGAFIADKPFLFLLGGVSATGAYLSHRIHQMAEDRQLAADFDGSIVDAELRNRGYGATDF